MALLCIIFLIALSNAAAPPVLNRSLASQLLPDNPAISSAFLIPTSSALFSNSSTSPPALRVPPSWSFSIGFSGATFLPAPNSTQSLSFNAQLDNGDPLPEWLNFARDTITFGGVTPKQSRGIQVMKIVVTAASGPSLTTSDAFTLMIAPHDLSLSGPLLTRNITANNKFSLVLDDWQGVQVDGAHVKASSPPPFTNSARDVDWAAAPDDANPPLSLALDTASFPWLTYDSTSRTLSGTPPSTFASASGPFIPAFVTLSYPPQSLTVSTNLTLAVLPSAFTTSTLPPILASPGSPVSFALAQYITPASSPALNITSWWDPQNATWLAFDQQARTLSGTVPGDVMSNVKVAFVARDEASGTVSRADMLISIDGARSTTGRTPTDKALRKAAKNVTVVVGVVFAVLASIIVFAVFLSVCRRCCAAHEHVDGAYVIDQSMFDEGLKSSSAYKSSLEKDQATSGVDASYLASQQPRLPSTYTDPAPSARTTTKAAFFGAIRERFGSDGSWRGRRGADGGSGRGARKSKISKPMVMLSSSTSVRDGFGDRGRGGLSAATAGGNFTIFGKGNNAGYGTNSGNATPTSSSPTADGAAPPRPPRADLSLSLGRVLMSPSAGSSPGTAVLAYDRSRSNSDPSQRNSNSASSGSPGALRSGSAPSLGVGSVSTQTGTGSGTQSTFATGDSARLTNAAGEVPFRRPGFNGRFETLAERSMREIGSPGVERSPGPMFPPQARAKAADASPASKSLGLPPKTPSPVRASPPKVPPKAASNTSTPSKQLTPPKSGTPAGSSRSGTPASNKSGTPASNRSNTPTSNKSSTPAKSSTASKTSSPLNLATSSKSNTTLQSGIPVKSSVPLKSAPSGLSKPGSEASLGAPSSYRNVFFGDKGNESDSSTEDVEHAVIHHAVKRSSSDTPETQGGPVKVPVKQVSTGKPRLVQFTHERTAAAGGQEPRRDVSQKAVLHGTEDSDPDAEMRIGLEYVRQLGHSPPTSNQDVARPQPSTSRISLASDPTRTPSVEFYASNDSNGSIAGRARVLAPLVINSHRGRHQAVYSMASSTHDSFVSAVEREAGAERGSRWMVEAALPREIHPAGQPFNFAAHLDRTPKHASALAGSALDAKLADGGELPAWLRFEAGAREFWGVAPKASMGEQNGMLVTRLVVKIWEVEKGEIVGGFVLDVLAER